MKNFDVVALGELLIDFTENGKSAQGNMTYEANPGRSALQRVGNVEQSRPQEPHLSAKSDRICSATN